MADARSCAACGAELSQEATVCPSCGGHDVATGACPAVFMGGTPTVIIDGPEASTGDHKTLVSSPGMHSETRLTQDGTLSTRVEGGDPGRPGEPTVVHLLGDKFREVGRPHKFLPGDDPRGEDRRLVLDGQTFTLQIVSTPPHPFWRDAKQGAACSEMDRAAAADLVHEVIMTKARMRDARTILAIDARAIPLLAHDDLLNEYMTRFGCPVREFGFVEVWIVGHPSKFVRRLGESAIA